MGKHGACLKTLPECLLKFSILVVLPWLVLSSQTELTYQIRLLIGLEFFAIGLINLIAREILGIPLESIFLFRFAGQRA